MPARGPQCRARCDGILCRHDIISLKTINSDYQEDADGLLVSAQHVEGLVRAEAAAGIPTERLTTLLLDF